MADAKRFWSRVKSVLVFIWELILWLIFNVLLPGFPFFLALFLKNYIEFADNISIVIYSDILLLGASLSSGVFESSLQKESSIRNFGLVVSLISLLFFLGIFFILYVPQVGYKFKKDDVDLEPIFWKIMTWVCLINIVLGILADVVLKYIQRGNPDEKKNEACS